MLSAEQYKEIAGVLAKAIDICEYVGDNETVAFIKYLIAAPLSNFFESHDSTYDHDIFMEDSGLEGRL